MLKSDDHAIVPFLSYLSKRVMGLGYVVRTSDSWVVIELVDRLAVQEAQGRLPLDLIVDCSGDEKKERFGSAKRPLYLSEPAASGASAARAHVLTVDSSDRIVWGSACSP